MPEEYDVDELRKRRILASAMEAPPPSTGFQDAPMTPAELNARNVAMEAPQESDYKPGLLRNILSAVAGFGTGMVDTPTAGVKMADTLRRTPFLNAQRAYDQRLKNALNPVEIEKQHQETQLKRQEEHNRGVNAMANIIGARSGVQWRPQSQEEAFNMEAASHPTQPRNPNAEELKQEFFTRDPEGYKRYIELSNPNRSLTMAERRELAELNSRLAEGRIRLQGSISGQNQRDLAQLNAANRPIVPESPVAETQRERLAIERLLRQDPQYEKFIKWVGSTNWLGKPNGPGYYTVKRPEEIKGIFTRWSGLDQARYNKFLQMIEQEKENLRSIGHISNRESDVPGLTPDEEEQ